MDRSEELTEIVIKVLKDKNQFELLYSKISNKVYFWCYTIIGNESDAKDAAQEAIIKIYNNIDELKSPGAFSSWMYRLVRNSCLNYLEKHKKENSRLGDSEDHKESIENTLKDVRVEHQPNQLYSLKETKEVIKEFVDNLPTKQREVITLFYLEEYSIKEISKILNYNTGSIRSRLHTARKNLETQISDYQIKNNIKLYSTATVPSLAVIIKEYMDTVCSNQNLQFDQHSFNNTSSTGGTSETASATGASATTATGTITVGSLTIVTSKLIIIAITIACICTAAVIGNTLLNDSNNSEKIINNASIDNPNYIDEDLFSKLKNHPYIEDINYLEFPMKNNVDITIQLKMDIDEKDFTILYNGEEILFEKNEKTIFLSATSNGIYTVITKDKTISFKINNIDIYAPELIEAFNSNGYLSLVIDDKLSQIDYNQSFIEYQGEKYQLPENHKIKGEFYGVVYITLFHQNGYKIVYQLDFK